MQTAGGLISVARELATGVQGAQDHLKRGFIGELGVRVDGDATTVVADGEGVVFVQFDLDPGGVACDGFVHRVVEDLGHHMVQGALVRAADIHAGALAHRFKTFENFDRRRVIGRLGGAREEIVWHVCCSFVRWLITIMAGATGLGKRLTQDMGRREFSSKILVALAAGLALLGAERACVEMGFGQRQRWVGSARLGCVPGRGVSAG